MASTAWERRNARARAEGFRNYYEKRTRQTPGAPKPSKEVLRRRRGHAGRADLERLLRSGRVELISAVQTRYNDPVTFDLLVTLKDGSQRTFIVKGDPEIRRLRGQLDDMGADVPQIVGSPRALKRLTEDDELDAEIAAHEAELERGEAGDEPYVPDDSDIPF